MLTLVICCATLAPSTPSFTWRDPRRRARDPQIRLCHENKRERPLSCLAVKEEEARGIRERCGGNIARWDEDRLFFRTNKRMIDWIQRSAARDRSRLWFPLVSLSTVSQITHQRENQARLKISAPLRLLSVWEHHVIEPFTWLHTTFTSSSSSHMISLIWIKSSVPSLAYAIFAQKKHSALFPRVKQHV